MSSRSIRSDAPPLASAAFQWYALSVLPELDERGFALRARFVEASTRQVLLDLLAPDTLPGAVRRSSGAVFAARRILSSLPGLAAQLTAARLDSLASQALGADAFPVDAVFFDKHRDANWTVPAHQDRLMPVQRMDSPRVRQRHGGFYAEPSPATLSSLVTLRLHFDDAGATSGALQLVPGSHRNGLMSAQAIRDLPLDRFEHCTATAGDVLVMRPLVLHRSSPAQVPTRRRILHVVYAASPPTDELAWNISASHGISRK